MFERVKAGWRLARATRKLIMTDKKLFLYPFTMVAFALIAAVAYFFLFAGLVFGFLGLPTLSFSNLSSLSGVIFIAASALFYIIIGFISVYVTIAMYLSFKKFEEGEHIGVVESLGMAKSYSKLALEWALFYFIVLAILRMIEKRIRGIGGAILGIVGGMALAAATLFAIPSITENRVGPIKAAKDSYHVIYRYFGSVFGGFAYVDLVSLGIVFAGFVLFIVSLLLILPALGLYLGIIGIASGIVIIVIGMVFYSVFSNIFRLILFDYVQGKGLPKNFDATEETVKMAIKRRRGRSGPGPQDSQS